MMILSVLPSRVACLRGKEDERNFSERELSVPLNFNLLEMFWETKSNGDFTRINVCAI